MSALRFGVRITALVSLMLGTAASPSVHAQDVGGGRGQGPVAGPRNAPPRSELEQRVRERTAQIVRRRLELNDDQMARLQAVNRQFDRQRIAHAGEERCTAQALRAELKAGTAANQQKVGSLLDQMIRLQRQRLDMIESEQRELAKFMTPVQRAKYFGLQTEIRSRMQQLRDQSQGARRGLGPPPRPRAERNFR